MLQSRHCALGGLYRVMHIASLSGRFRGCYAAITALRLGACTVLCKSRPCRDALGVVMLLSRHCALWGLYRVMHIASLPGRSIGCHADILTRPDRDETLHNTVQEDEVLAVP